MRNSIFVLMALLPACASVHTPEELKGMSTCMVANGQGLFAAAVTPEATSAEIKTSDCTFLFFGCKYVKAEINPEGVIFGAEGGFLYEKKFSFGTLRGKEIHRTEVISTVGKAIVDAATAIAKEEGPIVIDREQQEVRFPKVTAFNGLTGEGQKFAFSPACTEAQAAVGAVALDRLAKLKH